MNQNTTIQIKNLTIGYSRQKPILRDISLSAATGELIGIIGKNGIGKSTLLRTIARVIPSLEGSIFIHDNELNHYKLEKFSKIISYVPTHNLVSQNMRVIDLVSYGRAPHTNWFGNITKKDKNKIHEALNLVNLNAFKNLYVSELSDGEKQRAFIARALAQDTPLILLDEPVAFLDLPNRYFLIRLLTDVAEKSNKCIIMSIHDFELAFNECDKLWLLSTNGCVEGAPEDLANNQSISKTFNEADLIFNLPKFKFEYASRKGPMITISEINQSESLLKHTLNRIGARVSSSEASKTFPEIHLINGSYKIFINNFTFETKSFYEIARYLKSASGNNHFKISTLE
jgi:iron complex transport system ATP-binding protein